jgi:hypothetical protein
MVVTGPTVVATGTRVEPPAPITWCGRRQRFQIVADPPHDGVAQATRLGPAQVVDVDDDGRLAPARTLRVRARHAVGERRGRRRDRGQALGEHLLRPVPRQPGPDPPGERESVAVEHAEQQRVDPGGPVRPVRQPPTRQGCVRRCVTTTHPGLRSPGR